MYIDFSVFFLNPKKSMTNVIIVKNHYYVMMNMLFVLKKKRELEIIIRDNEFLRY